MAKVTQIADFFYRYNLPGKEMLTVQENITAEINLREPELLRDVLGITFYNTLAAAMDAANPPADPYAALLSGADFTDASGTVRRWLGLSSITVPYIYFYYTRRFTTHTMPVGETSTKSENAVRSSPNDKQVFAWNDLAASLVTLNLYLNANKASFPDWVENDLCSYTPINIFGL